MYKYVSAIAKSLEEDNRWRPVDIIDTRVIDIYQKYRRVLVTLTHPFLKQPVALDMEDIRSRYGTFYGTLQELLRDNGFRNLPTTNKIPTLSDRAVRYQDAFKSGYKVRVGNSAKSIDAEIPLGDKTSLYLQKPKLNYGLFGKYCMVSVNGYFHFVDVDNNGVWVIEGARSNLICNENLVGILSFHELGTIKHKQITPDMLFPLDGQTGYRARMGIDIGESLEGKTVILVLGGYLHVLDRKSFYQYNDTSIMINMSNLPLLERYQESRRYIDLSKLPVTVSSLNDSAVNVDDFLSEENLAAYATLPQSFIVLLDNDDTFSERERVRTPPTPGLMISFKKPSLPMVHGYGRLAHYWSREQHGQYSLALSDNQRSHPFWERVKKDGVVMVSDQEITQRPVQLSDGYFLRIGSDVELK